MWHAWEGTEKCKRFWWESLKDRDNSKDRPHRCEDWIRTDLWEIGGRGLDSIGSRQGLVAGCCECGDESSGSGTTDLVT
jgi:hypothetical protein